MNNEPLDVQKPMNFVLKIGSVTVSLQEYHFLNGYSHGYLFFQQCREPMTTDWSFYEFLMNIVTMQHSGRWNAGYIVGYMAALFHRPVEANADDLLLLHTALVKIIEEVLAMHKERKQQ